MSEQLQQRFDAQSERMNQLFAIVIESQKEARTNAAVLQNLLVGIENLGENFKNMQEEMLAWQIGYQNAEGEYHHMNEELLQEIPLSAPAEVGPESAVTLLVASVPPVPTSQFIVPALVSVPQSSGQSVDASIQSRWAKLSALRKPYPGAPPPTNWGSQGFNVSTDVQDSQAKIPQFFNFIGSRTDDVQVANKTSVNVSASSSQIPNSVLEEYPEGSM